MSMTSHHIRCLGPRGFHRLAFERWEGSGGARPVVCVHGLTRNGRDFDWLARALCERGPVYCPDMPGRGGSEWLAKEDYGYPQYLADTAALFARIGAEEIDFVGTSMGGIIGMMLAAQPGSPIRRLVVNDVGPFVPKEALTRIGAYVGRTATFASLAELESYLRLVHATFGHIDDAQWACLARHNHRLLPGGRYALNYDPAIAAAFQGEQRDVDLWAYYDRITCPTLVVRGAESDLLLAETASEMTRRGPKAILHEVPGAGHAPLLAAPAEIGRIARFLAE